MQQRKLVFVTGAATRLGLAATQALASDRDHIVVQGSPLTMPCSTGCTAAEFDVVIRRAGVANGPDVLDVNTVAPFVLTAKMRKPLHARWQPMRLVYRPQRRVAQNHQVSERIRNYRWMKEGDHLCFVWATLPTPNISRLVQCGVAGLGTSANR